jgi:K+-transporting ATPase KdpF subunit
VDSPEYGWKAALFQGVIYGPDHLASRSVSPGAAHLWVDVSVRGGLRKGLKGALMIWLTVIVALLLFIYLLAALLRPEWF